MNAVVRLEQLGPVAVMTLDNPPLNVTTRQLTRELRGIIDRVAADARIRVLIVTGAGERAFNAGSDIREMRGLLDTGDIVPRKIEFENETFTALENLTVPTIAALNGVALGGGLELALCCDFIVADEGARVGLPEIALGLIPGAGGMVRAARRVGEARARQLILLGEPITPQTALSWGLIDFVTASGELLATSLDLARRLAAGPAVALAAAKQAIALRRENDDSVALQRSVALFGEVAATPDALEGVSAFMGKRAPRFGR